MIRKPWDLSAVFLLAFAYPAALGAAPASGPSAAQTVQQKSSATLTQQKDKKILVPAPALAIKPSAPFIITRTSETGTSGIRDHSPEAGKPRPAHQPSLPVIPIKTPRASGAGSPGVREHDPENEKPRIQIAILLDASGSMGGLRDQAKNQISGLIKEVRRAKKLGMPPIVETTVEKYGQNGQEYCGKAIDNAVKKIDWSSQTSAYKAIFIAGNESFAQGRPDFHEAVAAAKEKGIFVNTIFCGPREEGVGLQWLEAARLGGGEYAAIDHNAPSTPINLLKTAGTRPADRARAKKARGGSPTLGDAMRYIVRKQASKKGFVFRE